MTSITAQIHIDTTSSTQPLPASPIPLSTSSTLAPSTQLSIPIPAAGHGKPQQLSDLADALNTTRASLNQVLTAWKDWAGKEDGRSAAPNAAADNNDDDDEGEDDDEDEEE
ncbi:conserved hypothetical protein [Sporisorium reilianum SRZ2]|uniref:Uncharacterized protein n=1 Tax=Sporisorium reilianum (strain SRZ2) TaxID=999809 RepID=E6ZU51_SPORE|nr:conserved hypothetical protein [Sporisorium reilianum SRZ2]